MSKELAKTNGAVPAVAQQRGFLSLPPKEMIARASEVAGELKNIIQKQGLWNRIKGKDHVRVEGWATMGSLLGIYVKEGRVRRLKGGRGYVAYMELVTMDGAVIGGASAICGRDEKQWRDAEEYAVRSMAITRASGKAYRLGFAWVMALAGYEPTPAEEMPYEPEQRQDPPPPKDDPPAKKEAAAPPQQTIEAEIVGEKRREASIYTGESKQAAAIEKILEQRKVPRSHWGEIDMMLRGKPSNELWDVIRVVTQTAASRSAPTGASLANLRPGPGSEAETLLHNAQDIL